MRRVNGLMIFVSGAMLGMAMCSEAWSIEVEKTFELEVTVGQTTEKSGCNVLSDGGFYRFRVRAPEGKELAVETIEWEGPPGLTPKRGSAEVTCQFDNGGCP